MSGAGVDGATPPPKPKATPNTSSASAPSSKNGSPPASPPKSTSTDSSQASASEGDDTSTPAADTKSDPSEDSTEATEASASDASTAKRGPRYELKAFKKWTEENPEQAVELAKAVFQIDVGQEFIKLQNVARRRKGEIREERTKAEKAAQEKLEAAQAAQAEAERIAGSLRYMADMWAAAQRKDEQGRPMLDFDTIDESFRQNSGGLSIDDYMRQRARRGVSSPELARERSQRLRLEAELAQLKNTGAAGKAPEAKGAATGLQVAAPTAAVAAPAAPSVNPEELWGDELPKTHQLREFRGWADELHREMQRHYDETLDEYSVDPEEVANKVLQRKLAAFQPAEEEQPAAPARRKPNTPKNRQRRPAATGDGIPSASELTPRNAPKGHRPVVAEELAAEMPKDYVSRERWALERAQRRLRGEAVD